MKSSGDVSFFAAIIWMVAPFSCSKGINLEPTLFGKEAFLRKDGFVELRGNSSSILSIGDGNSEGLQVNHQFKNVIDIMKQLNLKNDSMIDEYKTLKALDEVKYQPRLKEIKSMILRLDSKIGTYQKKQSLLNGSKIRTSEMIDATYATKAIVEQKIDEMDLIRDEMLLNGSSIIDSIDLESISELLANVESLSNHFERKSLDNIIEKGFVPQDRDKRFEEILRNEGLTVSISNLSELEDQAL